MKYPSMTMGIGQAESKKLADAVSTEGRYCAREAMLFTNHTLSVWYVHQGQGGKGQSNMMKGGLFSSAHVDGNVANVSQRSLGC